MPDAPDAIDSLILDFVEWIAHNPRSYPDVFEAWRTSCPRLTIWEDAVDRGFVQRKPVAGGPMLVIATPLGRAFLREHGRPPTAP